MSLGATAAALTSAGVAVAMVPAAQVTVLDPMAVLGLLLDTNLSRVEPAVVGRQVASSLFGSVSVNPAGAASVTAA